MQLCIFWHPGLGLFANTSPSARRTNSRKRSIEVASQLRSRLKAALPMPTGEGVHNPQSSSFFRFAESRAWSGIVHKSKAFSAQTCQGTADEAWRNTQCHSVLCQFAATD